MSLPFLLGDWLPEQFRAEPRAVDSRLTGVRLDMATFRRSARRELNDNMWRDYAIKLCREIVQDVDARARWEDDGGR